MSKNVKNTEAAVADTAATETAAAAKEKLLIPLNPDGAKGAVFICVNGKNIRVQRGVEVEVEPKYAHAWRNAQMQAAAAVRMQAVAAAQMQRELAGDKA